MSLGLVIIAFLLLTTLFVYLAANTENDAVFILSFLVAILSFIASYIIPILTISGQATNNIKIQDNQVYQLLYLEPDQKGFTYVILAQGNSRLFLRLKDKYLADVRPQVGRLYIGANIDNLDTALVPYKPIELTAPTPENAP